MIANATAAEVRTACRLGEHTGPTPDLASGFVQANLVVLPKDWAYDFLLFCQRNPKPCPLLEVCEVGSPHPQLCATNADLRTDLPQYCLWEQGVCSGEVTDITAHWRDDLVCFLIGCSFTFETALQLAGYPVRHIQETKNVPMYRTNRQCQSAGRFAGPLVVSMRPYRQAVVSDVARITAQYPLAHGAPLHWGTPGVLGIDDITTPDYGDAVVVDHDEVPVFWACGVTPQAALLQAKPPFAITHKPGHMFLTDWQDRDLLCETATVGTNAAGT
jgi:uncharacterized protein YcsI (UPF0317 family)